jgi:hypothetical protein
MPHRISVLSQLVPPAPHWTGDKVPDQRGRVALITGGHRDVGREIARVRHSPLDYCLLFSLFFVLSLNRCYSRRAPRCTSLLVRWTRLKLCSMISGRSHRESPYSFSSLTWGTWTPSRPLPKNSSRRKLSFIPSTTTRKPL